MTDHFVPAPEQPSPTGEALCLLCARRGTTCCRTDPELTYLSFPLSLPEWRRLIPYAELATLSVPEDGAAYSLDEEKADAAAARLRVDGETKPEDDGAGRPEPDDPISELEPNHPDFIASMHALFPGQKTRIAGLFPEGGRHGSLRTRRDGSCVFLGAAGCRLPRSARPWYCLLFPAWVVENGVTFFVSQDCLISQKASGPAHGIRLLGEKPAHIRELHGLLLCDWGLGSPTGRSHGR